jgi:hypothetical protein
MDQFARRLVGVGMHRGAVRGADLCRMFNAAKIKCLMRPCHTPWSRPISATPFASSAAGGLQASVIVETSPRL